jgi:hypothetical protein
MKAAPSTENLQSLRANGTESSHEESSAVPQGSVVKNSRDNNDNDSVELGFGTDDTSHSDQAPALILHTTVIAEEVVPTSFSGGADFSHATVIAEEVFPTSFSGATSHENPHSTIDNNRPRHGFLVKNLKWLLVLLVIIVAIVARVAIGAALQNGSSTNPETEPPSSGTGTTMPTMSVVVAPSNSTTISLLELLKPSIVRNDADLALLNDGISPQWRALDWLSTDSIALSENQSPTIILNRYVLAVLYYATSCDDWGQQLGSYLQPTSVCEWNNGNPWGSDNAKGVYCVTQSSVQQVTLDSFGLGGTVP